MEKLLFNYLESYNIQYKEYTHPPMFKVSDEEKIKASIPGEKSKNLLLKDNINNFYLVIWHAYSRLPTNKLKKHLKVKNLEFASPEELKDILHTTSGNVSLFAMIHGPKVNLIIDNRLWLAKESGYHPNNNTSTLVLSQQDLHKFVNSLGIKYQIVSFE